jgi:CYTH domain-containing protein
LAGYELPHGDATIELDEFGQLEGLVVAEVEFDSPQASEVFDEPEWRNGKSTTIPHYANRTLAEHGRPD